MRLTTEIYDGKYYTMISVDKQRVLLAPEENPDKYTEVLERAMDILEEAVK